MHDEELKAIFDQQASSYDSQWEGMAPIRDCLFLMLKTIFAGLPREARMLCVGVGTGAELSFLAREFPQWKFTVVEPSSAMLEICRRRADEKAFASRCYFHKGYLASLPARELHDGATCFLVSQFILDPHSRTAFFRGIAERLRPKAILASSDLSSDVTSKAYEDLLSAWVHVMSSTRPSREKIEQTRASYSRGVGILPPGDVASVIQAGGFDDPVQFFQAALMHAWFARRS